MKRVFGTITVLGLISLMLISCYRPGDTPLPPSPAPRTPAVPVKPSWQQDWENTITSARKEGKVCVISRFPSSVRDAMAEAFKDKYGLEVEYVAGTAVEIWPKVDAERRSGLYLRDIAMEGPTTALQIYVDGNAVEPMEPAFILPEVKDVNAWRDKRLPFFDKEGKRFMFLSRVGPTLVINKEMVKSEELRSWRNLLEPKWKGKILMYDPSIPGPGGILITSVSEIMGIDFLKELARQEPVINRDMRTQVEWVARGKYPIGLGFEFTLMEEMRGAGAPIAHVVPSEGTYFGSATGGMAMFNRPAHPNATKVFINWFLSREGQTLLARTAKEQSRRIDIAPQLAPDRLFQEGIKYVDGDTEYLTNKRIEMFVLVREIFAAQYK